MGERIYPEGGLRYQKVERKDVLSLNRKKNMALTSIAKKEKKTERKHKDNEKRKTKKWRKKNAFSLSLYFLQFLSRGKN